MGAISVHERRYRMALIGGGVIIGIILLQQIANQILTNGEYDAYKQGHDDCKEGIPPSNGEGYDQDEECEKYYEGYWDALHPKGQTPPR